MESYKIRLTKSQFMELHTLMFSTLTMRPKLQLLHYAELFLMHQALRRYTVKIERMKNEFRRPSTRPRKGKIRFPLRTINFPPPEGMIITLILTWIKPKSPFAQIALNEFFTQMEKQSDELQKFMVGKMYAGENQNDIIENFRNLKFSW